MNLEPTTSNAAVRQLLHSQNDTLLRGNWLIVARVVWATIVVMVLWLFIISLPGYVTYLQIVCIHQPCPYQQLTLTSLHSFQKMGISLEGYAVLTLTLTLGPALIWVVLGGLLVWRRSNDWMALLVAFMLIAGGVNNGLYGGITTNQAGWMAPSNLLGFLFGLTFFVVFSLFPSGHFAPRWMSWLVPVFFLNNFLYEFFPNWYSHLPLWASIFGTLDFFGSLLLLVLAQIYRYWQLSTPVQRQQTKWIVYSLALGIASMLAWGFLENFIPSLNGSLYDPLNAYLNAIGSLLFPISFAIAILRYRLWDIDIIINRTLVYGGLSACIVGLYVFVVGYLGALFRTGGNLLISLLATGLVAILFQPLREWLQKGVNRLFYGQRDEPYIVITRLSQRLEGTLVPEAVLPSIVETVAQALKLPYVAILLKREDAFVEASCYGKPVSELLTLPLTYQGETIGQLQLAPRTEGEAFTPVDQRLLGELARQAGLAVHAARLTADLQRSREHLVTAREEERRRLRRDLHDGLGATLAALHLQAGAIRTLMRNGIEATRQILHTSPHIRILVVTLFEDDASVFTALRAGARGYVLKDAQEEEMLRAIRAVGSGEAIFSPAIATRLMDYFAAPRPAVAKELFPTLSEREREILQLIARGSTNNDIARQLSLSVKTVSNYVSNIFSKLQVADRAQAIIRARDAGLE